MALIKELTGLTGSPLSSARIPSIPGIPGLASQHDPHPLHEIGVPFLAETHEHGGQAVDRDQQKQRQQQSSIVLRNTGGITKMPPRDRFERENES